MPVAVGACRDGMEGITVRKIAAELGSSVAPVDVNFSDLEELRDAVVERIVDISWEVLEETGTGRPFRDIGRASIRFAGRYPVISRDLTLRPNRYLAAYRSRMDAPLTERMEVSHANRPRWQISNQSSPAEPSRRRAFLLW